jgi:PKD repeat protein
MKILYNNTKTKSGGLFGLLFFALALLASINAGAQTYCTPGGPVNNYCCGGASAMGVNGFSMGSINNSVAPRTSGTNTPIPYDNYTSMSTTLSAGQTIGFTVTTNQSYQQVIKIWVDWNQDGTFNTSAPEQQFYVQNSNLYSHTGTITVPSGQAPGCNYRMRVYVDYFNNNNPGPCTNVNYGTVHDYNIAVSGASGLDLAMNSLVSPTTFVVGNNSLKFNVQNKGGSTINTATIGYQLQGSGAVTQAYTFSGGLAGCAATDVSLTAPLNITSAGFYTLKMWATAPNGTFPDGNSANDTITQLICTPLNGTYTIDPSGSGTSNFPNFTTAVAALKTCGIASPVVFNVAGSTFTEQISIPAISGVSATNTITFAGAGSANTILTYGTQTASALYTLQFNGSSYVKFRNMTIRSTSGSYGWTVHLLGSATAWNSVTNCKIECGGGGVSATGTNFIPVVLNNSTTSYSTGVAMSNNSIDSCTITGGWANITHFGTGTGSTGNYFRYNTISGAYQYGVYFQSIQEVKLIGNTLSMRVSGTYTTGSIGFYLSSNFSNYPFFHEINRNKITDIGNYAMYLTSTSGSVGGKGIMANNMIGGGFISTGSSYGIYMANSSWWNVYFNTVNLDGTHNPDAIALYISNGTNQFNIDVRNNMLQVSGTGTNSWPLWANDKTVFADLDFNNYYRSGTSSDVIYVGSALTKSNFKGANGLNSNSYNIEAPYASSKNLRYTNGCITGVYLSGITKDFDNDNRTFTPNVGADEFTNTVTNDIGILAITAPAAPLSVGANDVIVILKNFGSNTVTSAVVSYTLNGGAQKTINWSGSLPACAQISLTFTNTDRVNIAPGINTIRAFTSSPNGATDATPANDATQITACPGMSGTFTLDATGSGSNNFKTFADLVNALSCSGLNGPVTVNVAAGTYVEQVAFKGITGLSATNTLTIDGGTGNASSRILTFNNSQNTTRHTILFDNVSYITVKNLTIRNTSVSYGYNVFFYGTTSNINIIRCRIDYQGGNGASANGNTNFMPVVFSSNISSYGSSTLFSKIKLDSNVINGGGYMSVSAYGNGAGCTDFVFTNNVVENGYQYGLYFQSMNGVICNNNTISMRPVAGSTFSAVYWNSLNATGTYRHEFNNNRIFNASYQGVYFSSVSNSGSQPGTFYNNMIGGGFTYAYSYAVYFQSSSNWNIWFNSINNDAPLIGTYGPGAFYMSSGSGNNIRNNHFILSNPTVNSGQIYVVYITSGASVVDYNNYFKYGNTNDFIVINNNYFNASNFKGGGGYNANSYFTDPDFVSSLDLHAKNGCATGTAISGIATDFDGDTRNTPPSIGADEGPALDAGVMPIITPSGTVVSGTQTVSFKVRNSGRTTITSFTAGYNINGGTAVTQAWSGSLAPCDSVQITFSGGQSASFPSGVVVLAAFVKNPNGTTDANPKNDSTSRAYCNGGLSGTYSINGSSSAANNFRDFGAFMNVLNSCGMTGNLIVNIAPGTYNNQVLIQSTLSGLSGRSITFVGQDSSTTKLTYNGNGYTVKLEGADNITFRGIGIENTGNGNAYTVWITNYIGSPADNNKFENCMITAPSISNTTIIPYTIMGTSYSQAGNWGNNNILRNSYVSGGYISIHMFGAGTGTSALVGNKVIGNTITGATQFGTYIYYQKDIEVSENTFTGIMGSYCVYMVYTENVKMNRNKVFNNSTVYGLYTQYFNQGSSTRGQVENNMIGGTTYTGTWYGINMLYTYNTDIQHNTIHVTPIGGSNHRAAQFQQGSGNTLKNNIFSNETSGGMALYIDIAALFTSINYNNLYSTSPSLAYLWGTTAPDLATVKTVNAPFNANSVSIKPNFVNGAGPFPDLHLGTSVPSPQGDGSVSTTIDIDGDLRCPVAKTMGADESKFIDPVIAQFTAPDTVFINSSFMSINAAAPGSLKLFQWDFDNNGTIDYTSLNASHIFTSTGVKQIKLRASSCTGVDSMIRTVVVVNPTLAPVADFIADKYTILPFETITFQDLSTNGPTRWQWSVSPVDPYMIFTPSDTAPNPQMTFASAGVYTICLTAMNGIGTSAQTCKVAYVTVKAINNMCIFPDVSQGASGEIYDSGGPNTNYTANENCSFLIAPCASSVTLKFSQFLLGSPGASLKIYDGKDATAQMIGTYTNASGIPGGTNGLTASSGNMFLQWTSGPSASLAAGFAATWTSVLNTNVIVAPNFIVADTAYELTDVFFKNTSTGSGLNFDWDFDGDLNSDAGSTDGTFNFPAPGTYFPTLTISDACGNLLTKIDTIEIIVPPSAPVVDFESDLTVVTTSDTVKFTDLSTFGPFSWNYTFNPSTVTIVGGTAKNPWVKFDALGTYSVTLDASNNVGTGTHTKTSYIKVVSVCNGGTTGLVPDIGINRVQLGDIDNLSASGQSGYTSYFSSVSPAMLDAGGTYDITISRNSTLNKMNRRIWIDYNADGDFDDVNETVGAEAAALTANWKHTFTVPTTATRGATRMRIGTAFGDSTNLPCGPNFYGEIEEYRVVITDDITPPVITLRGSNPVTIEIGSIYTDSGATAFDAVDQNVTSRIVTTNNVNTLVSGTYLVRYNADDLSGNDAVEVTRTVIVTKDLTPPVLTLNPPLVVTIPVYGFYVEPGYSATDKIAGNVTASVVVDSSSLNTDSVGTYIITYTAYDAENNPDVKTRTVHVVDQIAPVITLLGADPLEVEVFTTLTDPGVSVVDNYDQNTNTTIVSNVNTSILGSYTITYTAKDASGNISSIQRTVNVVDNTAPVIQVFGPDTVTMEVHGTFTNPYIIATDNYDQNPTVTASPFNTHVIGDYTVNFTATDGSGNQSLPESVVVRVVDTQKPVITLVDAYLITVERWAPFSDPGVKITDNYYDSTTLAPVIGGNFVNTLQEGLFYITYNVTDGSGNKATEVVRAVNVVANTTGINKVAGHMDMNVYPNPATSSVTVELANSSFSKGRIEIVNLLGKTVRTITPEDLSSSHVINTSDLAAGVYLLHVENKGEVSLKRLVITR